MSRTHFAMPPITCIFLILLVQFWTLTTAQSPDAKVMFELKQGLTFTDSSLWSDPDPCKWEHVQCNNNRVTRIQIGGVVSKGSLPKSLNQLTELQVFEVFGNQMTGDLPTFSGLSSLQSLLLNGNQFSSIPDDFFKGLTSLEAVYLDNNPFKQWNIPETLKDAVGLRNFSAISANIIGTIPGFLGNGLASLIMLRLSFNYLEGGLPVEFAGSTIQSLWLNGQKSNSKLNGSIDVLKNMTSLTDVWLNVNEFTGPIPDVTELTRLEDFCVRDNQLTGPVPDSLMNLASLKKVNLTNNLLQGKMPKFGNGVAVDNIVGTNKYCSNVVGVDCDPRVNIFLKIAEPLGYPVVFAQDWSGNDPCSWGGITCDSGTKNVTVINFQNKQLTGTIAPEFSSLTSLQRLYLNNNNLSGTVPAVFADMPKLSYLDISNNKIYGQLPKFKANVVVKYDATRIGEDDPGTTGTPTGSTPKSGNGSSPEIGGTSGSKKSATTVGIVLGSAGGFIILCVALFLFVKKRKHTSKMKRMNTNSVVIHPRHSGSDQDIKISIAGKENAASEGGSDTNSGPNSAAGAGNVHVIETGNMVISIQVLRNVTNNFSKENILGSGGFGTVYKGELHDGTKLAVKRMESGAVSDKGLEEFHSEIEVLSKVRHKNLVNLLGHCLEGNEKLLVYEYMPQGTLSSHLFHWAKENLKPLEWSRRLTIALDVARGVEYLHNLAHQSFIHRDLKPSNILLGDDMRAKVADFGLVRLAPDGKMSFATKLAGTFGYLAPEYAVTGRVTTKVDVFSFGVILMELITGRKALDDSQPDESCHLVTWFRKMSVGPDTFQKSIDPVIEITEETLSSIQTVAELAGYCSARDPSQRPDMGHVVNVLSSLAEMWKPSKQDSDDLFGFDLEMTLPQALKKWQQSEGSNSSSFLGNGNMDDTQTSIPARPNGFGDSFKSSDGR